LNPPQRPAAANAPAPAQDRQSDQTRQGEQASPGLRNCQQLYTAGCWIGKHDEIDGIVVPIEVGKLPSQARTGRWIQRGRPLPREYLRRRKHAITHRVEHDTSVHQNDRVGAILKIEVRQLIRSEHRRHPICVDVGHHEHAVCGNDSAERDDRPDRAVGAVHPFEGQTLEQFAGDPVDFDKRVTVVAPDGVVEHFGNYRRRRRASREAQDETCDPTPDSPQDPNRRGSNCPGSRGALAFRPTGVCMLVHDVSNLIGARNGTR